MHQILVSNRCCKLHIYHSIMLSKSISSPISQCHSRVVIQKILDDPSNKHNYYHYVHLIIII